MFSSRRAFIQHASAFGLVSGTAASRAGWKTFGAQPSILRSGELASFVDPLPLPAYAKSEHSHSEPAKIRIAMRELHAKIHRDLPATRFWSYSLADSAAESTALAPVIEARAHQPLQIEWINQLPGRHFLPIDYSLHGCGRDLPEVRACVHVHGARVPSGDDGQPDDWFDPGHSRTCTYPLQQDAAGLWYHDHAMGLNRLNIYAGLVGQFLLRDEAEDRLHLPSGKYEVPLMLYDRLLTTDGQLFYPTSGDPEHPWVSEFAGDAILINGKLRPYFQVEPRLYRFRILNAANSSFFTLSLSNQAPVHQIGSDQGLLAAPVRLASLGVAPAERADLLVDFSGLAGQKIRLLHNASAILEFRVASTNVPMPQPAALPSALRTVPRAVESQATVTRTITLNEFQDTIGNPMVMMLNRKRWHEPVTERPRLNSTEIWEFLNLTEDTHPMHLHMVRFQVLDRRVFEPFDYQTHGRIKFLSGAITPEPNELGWKDVVQCPPGMITRIIVKFEGYAGKYLYHCHILEHESNDMMRPFEVIA